MNRRDDSTIGCTVDHTSPGNTVNGREEASLLMVAAKGGLLSFAGTTVGRILMLFLQILVSRIYGPQYYGIFVTCLLICQITQIISGLGLQKGGMRFLAIAHERQNYEMMPDIVKTAVLFPLLFGTFAGAILYGLAPFLAVTVFKDAEMMSVLRQFSFAVPFLTILRISSDLSRAFKTTKYAVMIENLLFSLLQVVYSFVLATVVCSFWMLFLVRRQMQRFITPLPSHQSSNKHSILPRNWQPILAYSIPLTPFGLFLIASNSMDIIMLNILTDSARVGEYAAAARCVMFFGMMSYSFELIFGPLMAGQFGLRRYSQLKVLYRASTRWVFFLTLPLCVFQLLSREPLMLIFGKEFLPYGPGVLGILVVGSLFTALSGSAGILLTISSYQYAELACLVGSMLLNMLLNLLWIPRFGVYGAALATIVTGFLTVSARIMTINRFLKMHPFSIHLVVPVVVASILVIGGLLVESVFDLNSATKVIIGIGAGCVVSLSIIVTGFDNNDRELWRTVRKKFARNPPV
ncbi:MAG: polysaccharide biosynthesis C-terminal domain-containing protein [Deltaproteobacteria bacterium]|nr:polysaccharide biosynthesis C-terminal domain-containing protein [Deltaproteobacteria bacterium]